VHLCSSVHLVTNPRQLPSGTQWDGVMDLAAALSYNRTVSVLFGVGDGTFASAVTYGIGARGSLSVAIGDFDGDGAMDIATSNTDNTVSILLG
jgi:FG-GAP-like repeat